MLVINHEQNLTTAKKKVGRLHKRWGFPGFYRPKGMPKNNTRHASDALIVFRRPNFEWPGDSEVKFLITQRRNNKYDIKLSLPY